jgi:poly(A) polymerase
MAHPRFRAAYDFLLLRAESGEVDGELARWWTDFQAATPEMRDQMTAQVSQASGAQAPERSRRRRRRRGRGKGPSTHAPS